MYRSLLFSQKFGLFSVALQSKKVSFLEKVIKTTPARASAEDRIL